MTFPSSTPLLCALMFVLLAVAVVAQDPPVATGPPVAVDTPLESLPTPSPSPQATPPGTRCPGNRRVHIKPPRTIYWEGLFRDRVVFKLIDHLDVELISPPANLVPFFRNRNRQNISIIRSDNLANRNARLDRTVRGSDQDLEFLNQVIAQARPITVRPNFTNSRAQLRQLRERGEKQSCISLAHLEQYYVIYLNRQTLGENIANQLNQSPLVEIAYLPPVAQVADLPPATPAFETAQHYLDSGRGIDARYAWRFTGGRGTSMRIVDVEGTWNFKHEDLPEPFWFKGSGEINEGSDEISTIASLFNAEPDELGLDTHHGTAAAGVLVAKIDAHGVTGIASKARWGAASAIRSVALWGVMGGTSGIHDLSVSDAALNAYYKLRDGDVILIEQHSKGPSSGLSCPSNCSQFEYVPMEYFPDCFDAFEAITRAGVIVVEAAGNGGMNLDSAIYESRFKRRFRDSGAIMVAASRSTSRIPLPGTNGGSRIDVHAWGENVTTTGYGEVKVFGSDTNQFYTNSFGGTSSASPIVAGAVLSIQGILKASGQGLQTPDQMRTLLVTTGRPQAAPSQNTPTLRIGPMPNLRAALRDFDATSPSAGGTGGTPYSLRCSEGQALVGIRGRAKAFVDQIVGICGNPAGLGSETAPAGGNGGDAFTSQCGRNEVVVGLYGRSGAVIDAIGIECAKFKNNKWKTEERSKFDPDGGDFGSRFGPNRCTTDRIGVGFKGGAGIFVDRIQLICSTQEPNTERDTWTSAPVGTAQGEESRLQCGAGEAMVGIAANTGGWFDNIGPICARVNDDGTWDGRPSPRLGFSGGDGGSPTQMTCATDEAISGIAGRAGDHLYFLRIYCRPLSSPTSLTSSAVSVGAFGGFGGQEFRRIDCPARLPANGLLIRSDQYVNQIQLICGAQPEANP